MTPPATPPTPRIHRHEVDSSSDTSSDKDVRFAREIEQKVVGPMPPRLFLETFLPRRTRVPKFGDVTFSGVPDEPDRESAIYSPLVSVAQHPLITPPLIHHTER